MTNSSKAANLPQLIQVALGHHRAGQLAEAEAIYRQVLAADPGHFDALHLLGLIALAVGQPEQAVQLISKALARNPSNPTAHFNLGNAFLGMKHFGDAEASYKNALKFKPDYAEAYGNLGNLFVAQKRLAEAEACCKKVVKLKPELAEAHNNLGNVLRDMGRMKEAESSFRKALAISPNHAEIHNNLGIALKEQGRHAEAEQRYRKALELKPDFAEAAFNLGNLLQAVGRPEESEACCRKALAINPGHAAARNTLGVVLKELGRAGEAEACFRASLASSPGYADAWVNLGRLLQKRGLLDEAEACCRKALELKPDLAVAYSNLGYILQERGQMKEAAACCRKALEFNPELAEAHNNLGNALKECGHRDEAIIHYRAALALKPDFYSARSSLLHELQQVCEWKDLEPNVLALRKVVMEAPAAAKIRVAPFVFMALPGTTLEEQKRCPEKWVQNEYGPLIALREKLGFGFDHVSGKKISVGYLSADFRQHPVSCLMAEVFELHDRSRFEVTAYSYGADDGSAMRKRLERAFDRFVDIRGDSYEQAARKIHEDRINILVDLTGYTQNNRSAILALRPAPVQVNYLGYPGTMGAEFVDYMIADNFTIPPGYEVHYTEKIMRLPDCFQANDRTRARPSAPGRKDCGLPEQGVVFCCFNQTYKITPDMFDIWCRLLNAVPGSVLWLSASNPHAEENLKREAKNRGVDERRLIMAPLLDYDSHLARLQCADIFLDTLPYNAGTTCSDALWMGLPVVTCAGEAFVSRMAGSLLTALGVPELITCTLEDYYALALDLAVNQEKREAMRARIIASRDTAPLFDSERFTRNLEAAYEKMLLGRV